MVNWTYVKRKDLNITKYNLCVERAQNRLIYAFSWYLDVVSENWDCLILGNYEAVFPLPFKKKLGFNYVYLAPWIQQLGFFYQRDLIQYDIDSAFKLLKNRFILIDQFFNSNNSFFPINERKRNNFILALYRNYEQLLKDFYKGRKSALKISEQRDFELIDSKSISDLIELYRDNYLEKKQRSKADLDKLEQLFEAAKIHRKSVLKEVRKNGELLGGAFFLIDENRIFYLFSAVNGLGKEFQVMTFLINSIIQKYSNTNYILDFEGSMDENIALFFKGFGAQSETYFHLKQFQIPFFDK